MSERKYSQRGYKDREGRNEEAPRKRPRDRGEGPRGRGLGAPTATVSKCARCGSKIEAIAEPEQTCSNCGSDLHTCSNCRHFDPSAPNECRQPIEVRIAAKSKRNQCESFEAKLVQEHGSDTRGGARDAKSAFDDLFNF